LLYLLFKWDDDDDDDKSDITETGFWMCSDLKELRTECNDVILRTGKVHPVQGHTGTERE
jgi:hypothetical protein